MRLHKMQRKAKVATFASDRSCQLLNIGQPFINNLNLHQFCINEVKQLLVKIATFCKLSMLLHFGCFSLRRVLCKRTLNQKKKIMASAVLL